MKAGYLSGYPFEKIVIACPLCGKRRRYDRQAMIERVGPDIALPTLLIEVAARLGCEIAQGQVSGTIRDFRRCKAIYPELAER